MKGKLADLAVLLARDGCRLLTRFSLSVIIHHLGSERLEREKRREIVGSGTPVSDDSNRLLA